MARSLIAASNALFRARETERPERERVLTDPWAKVFTEHDPRILALRHGRRLAPPLARQIDRLQTAHCVRHRAVDELLLRALKVPDVQVVIVGAGYDMRRSRFVTGDDVRWVEVDHPDTQLRKWALLDHAHGVNRSLLTRGVDLLDRRLSSALAGILERDRPTVYVLEGLIHYLSAERLSVLLEDLALLSPRRQVVLSFIRSDMYASADAMFIELVKLLREIPRLHFTRAGLEATLGRGGLDGLETWTGEAQIEAFAPVARGREIGLSQDVAVARSAGWP